MLLLSQKELPEKVIKDFCEKWSISEFALFGSVLRTDFNPELSDIDVLVSYLPGTKHSYDAYLKMLDELNIILGCQVDLVEKETLLKSRNYLRRDAILNSSKVIHAA